METLFFLTGSLTLGALFALLVLQIRIQALKSKIVTGVSVQCSSGDSEVMTFNANFTDGESEDSKASKLNEAFTMIQDRRDFNHERFLAVKAAAIRENEAKDPETLKLRSITQEKAH